MTNKSRSKQPEAEPVGPLAEIADAEAAPGNKTEQTYEVTKVAGPRVAGRRVKTGTTISLSDAEAMTELLNGSIVLKEKV